MILPDHPVLPGGAGTAATGGAASLLLSTSLSAELSPLDIGEELAPIRTPKPAGQTELDFGGLLSPPLKLHEDLREGCGGQVWPAGVVLGRYLLARLDELVGKTILELGAGVGLTGLALALALDQRAQQQKQHQQNQPEKEKPKLRQPILITDLAELLPLQEQNITLNKLRPESVQSACLPWGGSDVRSGSDGSGAVDNGYGKQHEKGQRPMIPADIPLQYHRPDVVLAADCVYFEPAFPLLLDTLHALLDIDDQEEEKRNDGQGLESHPAGPICYFCMKKRRKADMRFIATLKKHFAVEPLAFEPVNREERNIFLFAVRGRNNGSRST